MKVFYRTGQPGYSSILLALRARSEGFPHCASDPSTSPPRSAPAASTDRLCASQGTYRVNAGLCMAGFSTLLTFHPHHYTPPDR